MTAATATATSATFVWTGMVLAISFLEAPLKFRAPGITLRLGLGIGRLVFRALNAVEVILAIMVVIAMIAGPPPGRTITALAIAIGALVIQLAAIRPRLNRRTDAVLKGEDPPGSVGHYAYIGLEVVKLAALLTGGIMLL
jgi:hypothetical protein